MLTRLSGGMRARLSMPWQATLFRSVMAGVLIAAGAALMLVVRTDPLLGQGASAVLSGLCFSAGLIGVMGTGSVLFTGECLMSYGVLRRELDPCDVALHLACAWGGNLLGALAFAGVMWVSGVGNMGTLADTALAVGYAKANLPVMEMVARGMLCNVMVCTAVWLGSMQRSLLGKAAAAIPFVTVFIACGFEHSVANMFVLPYAAMCGWCAFPGIVTNLVVVTAANLVGGAITGAIVWLREADTWR